MKKTLIFLTIFVLICSCSGIKELGQADISFYSKSTDISSYPRVQSETIKNVILFIADGTSFNHILHSRLSVYGPGGRLYLERLPIIGIQSTYSLDKLVTDSAASATALATGYKTNNGMLSYFPDSTSATTLLEYASRQGKSTGLVATSTITHATPAAFTAHVKSRDNHNKIAEGFFENKVNVILGGGRKYFMPKSVSHSSREDDRDLQKEFLSAGYSVVQTREELQSVHSGNVLGLFQLDELSTEDPEPMLGEMTIKAIELLSADSDGFFLMVEGSQIDWEAHDNDSDDTARQLLLFDMAVKAGMEFALRDENTLVIVTGDHETGGMVVTKGSLERKKPLVKWTSGSHTPTLLPVYAYGPGSENFAGTYDNTDIAKKLANLMDILDFPGKKFKKD